MATVCTSDIKIDENCLGFLFQDTKLSKAGMLTLYQNLVHPGYEGRLSTHVVNFSNKRISLKKGQKIFELLTYKNKNAFSKYGNLSSQAYERKLEEAFFKHARVFLKYRKY